MLKSVIAFGTAGIGLGYIHSRLGGLSHAERLSYTRRYNHGGDLPISLILCLTPAMILPPITLPLAIPGLAVAVPLLMVEMVGLGLFDFIDESLYKHSSFHRERFDKYEQKRKKREDEEREKGGGGSCGGGCGNPQITFI